MPDPNPTTSPLPSASSENSASSAVQASYPKSSQTSSSPPLTTQAHHSKSKVPLLLGLAVLVLGLLGGGYYLNLIDLPIPKTPQSYQECLTTPGSILQESYPQVCVTKSGARFTQPLPSPSPTTDPTANWQTNKIAALQFKFPNNWQASVLTEDQQLAFRPTSEKLPELTLYTLENPNDLSLREFGKDWEINPNFYSDQATEKEISGVTGYYQESQNCEPVFCDKFAIPYNKKIYVAVFAYKSIDQTSLSQETNQYRPIFNLILSTFKFLDQNSETANWKTFTSGKASFKYPGHLTLAERGLEKNYLVLLTDPNDSTSSVVDVDLSLNDVYADYENAVNYWQELLINDTSQEISNGIKMSGYGQAESEGEFFTVAFLKYQQGAITVTTLKTDTETLKIFDLILSTFKFTN